MLSAVRKRQLNKFKKLLNISDLDIELLNTALTHSSYNYESDNADLPDYERLEFLGDSVLRICVSEYLFDKYPDYNEGKLTKIRSTLVSDRFISTLADKINLKNYLNMGIHEEKDGGREKESINACAFEAVLGAVYKTAGFEEAKNFIYRMYADTDTNFDEIMLNFNTKELLQQYTQGLNKDLPEYKIINESGKAHNKTFEVSVIYQNKELGRGTAKTKKDAEKNAAYNALKNLKVLKECKNG